MALVAHCSGRDGSPGISWMNSGPCECHLSRLGPMSLYRVHRSSGMECLPRPGMVATSQRHRPLAGVPAQSELGPTESGPCQAPASWNFSGRSDGYHALPFMSESEKGIERDLILRGGPWSPDERNRILDYCERDVERPHSLFDRMRPAIDLERALVRGWYTKSVARMEHTGIPLDVPMFDHLRANLDQLSQEFISGLDPSIDVYEGSHFRETLFLDWLDRRGYRWPQTATGKPALDDSTLDRMATVYPDVRPLRDLRKALGEFRAVRALPIGAMVGTGRIYGRSLPRPVGISHRVESSFSISHPGFEGSSDRNRAGPSLTSTIALRNTRSQLT